MYFPYKVRAFSSGLIKGMLMVRAPAQLDATRWTNLTAHTTTNTGGSECILIRQRSR
jgi:hypothetical protein